MKGLCLGLCLLAAPVLAALPAETVVDIEAASGAGAPEGWAELEGKLSGAGALDALDAYLKKHPKGRAASRAQLERARRIENLELATLCYRAALEEDPQGPWGMIAALELGKQEYGLGRPESALGLFSALSDEQLQGENKAQLLFWRGQCRLVLKGFQLAQDDFENFLKNFPEHPLADAARLAVADCDAALRHDEAALKGYQKLYEGAASSVAPQAALQAGGLMLRGGRAAEARKALQGLMDAFPESFEAGRARELLKDIPQAAATPVPGVSMTPVALGKTGYSIQVGAYANRKGALALFRSLRKKRLAVRMDKRVIGSSVFYVVQVGRYADKAKAQAAAQRLRFKDFRVVEVRGN